MSAKGGSLSALWGRAGGRGGATAKAAGTSSALWAMLRYSMPSVKNLRSGWTCRKDAPRHITVTLPLRYRYVAVTTCRKDEPSNAAAYRSHGTGFSVLSPSTALIT